MVQRVEMPHRVSLSASFCVITNAICRDKSLIKQTCKVVDRHVSQTQHAFSIFVWIEP